MARSRLHRRISLSFITFLLYTTFPLQVSSVPTPSNIIADRSFRNTLPAPQIVPSENGVHVPIQRSVTSRRGQATKRQTQSSSIALGDVFDVTYNVLLTFSSPDGTLNSTISTPLVLDTGSSDLWVLSTNCIGTCTPGVPFLPPSSFTSTGVPATLLYGDSLTGTRATGPIGTTTVTLAGIRLDNQFVAAIENTNTSVLRTGSAGIFGLGFPINSVVFAEAFKRQFPAGAVARRGLNTRERTAFPKLPSQLRPSPAFRKGALGINNERTSFPTLPRLLAPVRRISKVPVARRQDPAGGTSGTILDVLSSFSQFGPFVSRLIPSKSLLSPLVTLSLQRNTLDIGGNVGLLSLGSLPPGVAGNTLHWLPVRGYSFEEGGLPAPPDSPDEVYPIAWEVYIDEVWFNGQKMPKSNLTVNPNSGVRLRTSALLDSGNSLIRGPQDVVSFIYSQISGGSTTRGPVACNVAHNLTYVIGGLPYTIDPRDFLTQHNTVGNADPLLNCFPNLVATDPPGLGFLYSWSLGDPFFKSNLISFYFGNLTYPSKDPPRVGLLSTVPQDASNQFNTAVNEAQTSNRGVFPSVSVPAPSAGLDGPGGVRGIQGYGELDVARFATAPAPVQSGGPNGLGGNPSNTAAGGNGQREGATPNSAVPRIASGRLISTLAAAIGGIWILGLVLL